MEDLSELKLQSMNIYDLRQVAKELGVPKPTTYKKEQLVSMVKMFLVDEASLDKKGKEKKAINKRIDEEKLKQEVKKLEKKKLQLKKLEEERLGNSYVVNSQKNDNYFLQMPNEYQFTFSKNPAWKLSHNIVDKKAKKGQNFVIAGYYFRDNSGSSFIIPQGEFVENKAVFVPNSLVQNLDIRQGDFVEGLCKNAPECGGILTEIENITDFDARQEFSTLKHVNENPKVVNIQGSINQKFVEGSRNLLRIKDFYRYNELSSSFKSLAKKFTFIQYDYETLPEFNFNGSENFYTFLGENDERNNFVFNMMISRIKRLVEKKKKIVLLIDEISKIVKFQNYICSFDAFDLKKNSLKSCRELMNLAGNYENGASVTIIALIRKNGFNENTKHLENEFIDMNCSFYDYD